MHLFNHRQKKHTVAAKRDENSVYERVKKKGFRSIETAREEKNAGIDENPKSE